MPLAAFYEREPKEKVNKDCLPLQYSRIIATQTIRYLKSLIFYQQISLSNEDPLKSTRF